MLKKEDIRDIIKLKDDEKFTFKDIAKKLGLTEPTAEYRYKVGKLRFGETLRKDKENIENSLRKDEKNIENNPIPEIVKRVENPRNWRKKDNSLEKKTSFLKERDNSPKEEKESKGGKKVSLSNFKNKEKGGNWLFFIIVSCIVVLIAFFVAREIKKGEGGGGSKAKSPEPITPIAPSIPEGREWTQ